MCSQIVKLLVTSIKLMLRAGTLKIMTRILQVLVQVCK